jgi:hypothetical protein
MIICNRGTYVEFYDNGYLKVYEIANLCVPFKQLFILRTGVEEV